MKRGGLPGRLSRRDRRALALGALVVLPALLWVFGGAPYVRALRSARAELEKERTLLAGERGLVASRDLYPAALDEATERVRALAPRIFSGGGGSAIAELSGYVRHRANASRVLLSRIAPGEEEELDGGVAAVSLNVEGESDLRGIVSLVHLLESGEKLVRVGRLRIGRLGSVDTGGGDAGWERLFFSLRVSGLTVDLRNEIAPGDERATVSFPSREEP